MRAELANLNHCAVPFLSRATVNLSWYDSIQYSDLSIYHEMDRKHGFETFKLF